MVGAALAGLLLYAVIPNLNVGAERYGYFSAACLCLGLALVLKPSKAVVAAVVVHSFFLLLPLSNRLADLETRVSLAHAEVRDHPEVGTNWSNAALALLELGGSFVDEAEPLLERALSLSPEHPRVWLAEFAYRFRKGDADQYARLWRDEGDRFLNSPRLSAGLEFQLGLLRARQGQCQEASARFDSASRRDTRLAAYRRPMCG